MSAPASAVSDLIPGTRPRSGPGPAYTLSRRRVYILPTSQGIAFAFAIGVMLIGAINYNNGLGHLLAFLLAALGLVSILHTYRNLAGLSFVAGAGEPVFAGGVARLVVHVDNRGQRARHALVFRYRDRDRDDDEEDSVVEAGVGAREYKKVELALRAPRRGVLTPERIVVATRFPFGLFRAWSVPEIEPACLVYPRPAGRRELPPASAESRMNRGALGAGRDDFSGFRDYVPGDSPRQIHWKAAARGRDLPVKLFSGANAGELALRWTESPGDTIESRLSQLCLWVLEADAAGMRYSLDLPGRAIPPAQASRRSW